ncbi:hypothetical protein ACQKMD_18100 [Viridibacillus sp. NPDC096237]|uniref:hypothetical protein n=1 Tax=Viridibacillus sp. NPDC096237 TaxID=3390721 RepID=UPI003D0215D0
MKKIFFLMLIVNIIAGCNGISSLNNTYNQAQGKVIVDNKSYTMMIGNYEWKEDDFEAKKISNSDINDLAGGFDTLEVKKGNKLKIEIEQNPSSIIVNQLNADGTSDAIELKDNEITLPSDGGTYIYEVIARWKEGKISYIFDVNIK